MQVFYSKIKIKEKLLFITKWQKIKVKLHQWLFMLICHILGDDLNINKEEAARYLKTAADSGY